MSDRRWPVSVKGVVVIDGRVVLLHNERDEWELPGGRLEADESPEQCVAREIVEELGISVDVGPLLDAWVYTIRSDRQVLVLAYGCLVNGAATPRHSHEHDGLLLADPSELDRLRLPDGYRHSIRRWFATTGGNRN